MNRNSIPRPIFHIQNNHVHSAPVFGGKSLRARPIYARGIEYLSLFRIQTSSSHDRVSRMPLYLFDSLGDDDLSKSRWKFSRAHVHTGDRRQSFVTRGAENTEYFKLVHVHGAKTRLNVAFEPSSADRRSRFRGFLRFEYNETLAGVFPFDVP